MKEYTLGKVKRIRDAIRKLGDLQAEGNKLWAEGDKLQAKGNKLRAEADKLWAENNIRLFGLLIKICPEAHYRDWGRYLAVPKSGKVDWIIPVFEGEYGERKHTAYSIWSMPKESCNPDDAVLFEEGRKKGGEEEGRGIKLKMYMIVKRPYKVNLQNLMGKVANSRTPKGGGETDFFKKIEVSYYKCWVRKGDAKKYIREVCSYLKWANLCDYKIITLEHKEDK